MVSITSLYLIATASLFCYTMYEQVQHSNGYFAAIVSYMSDQTNLFIVYNAILSLAILIYKACVWAFFDRTLEGEAVVSNA
jgi:hypothetical protein